MCKLSSLTKPASTPKFLLKIGKLKNAGIHVLNPMEFMFPNRAGFEKSQELCSGPALGCKSRIKALKTLFAERWLSWTDGKEDCQRLSLREEEKVSIRILALDSRKRIQFLSSVWLCSQPSAPFQWSAWRKGSPKHHTRARLQRHWGCQTEIRELPKKWLRYSRPGYGVLVPTNFILRAFIRERMKSDKKLYSHTQNSIPPSKLLLFFPLLLQESRNRDWMIEVSYRKDWRRKKNRWW